MHTNTYQCQIFQKPICLPKQETIRVTGLNCLCDVCPSDTKRWSEQSWREAKDDMTDLSATVSVAFSHKGIFLTSYKDSLGAKCRGERFESGETLHVSREETTGRDSLLCMFPLCGRPKNSQIISQMYTDSISSVFVKNTYYL